MPNRRKSRRGGSGSRNNGNAPRNGNGPRNGNAPRNGNSSSGLYSSEPPAIVLTHHESMGAAENRRKGKKTGGPKSGPGKKTGRPQAGGQSAKPGQPGKPGRGRPSRGRRPQNDNQRQGNPRQGRAPQNTQAAAPSRAAQQTEIHDTDPSAFDLFCAYHLGITGQGTYKAQNINEIARRFNIAAGRIKQLLQVYGIDSDTVINADFDMALAQLDMMVAPPGIDRRELAKTLYDEFMAAPKKARDWQRELREDAEANRRTFGK